MGHDETTNEEINFRQFERASGAPVEGELKGNSPSDSQAHLYVEGLLERAKLAPRDESEKVWPYTSVYFMPNGDVETRNHIRPDGVNSMMAVQAFMVLLVKHPAKPFTQPKITVTKFRGDLGEFLEEFVKGYVLQSEGELMRKMFPHIEGNH